MALKKLVDENNPTQAQILNDIRIKLRSETFTRQSILEVIRGWALVLPKSLQMMMIRLSWVSYPELVRLLYIQFAMTHYIQAQGAQLMPTLSYQRLHVNQVLSEDELQSKLRKTAANSHDLQVLQSFMTFNKAVLKTKSVTSFFGICTCTYIDWQWPLQLLPAHQSRPVLPPRSVLSARCRISEQAFWHLFRSRFRVPRFSRTV